VSVKRTINSVTKRHIEKFVVGNRQKQDDQDAENLWYLDNAIQAPGTGHTTVTGLDHLEGETITVLADGVKGSYTVASGSITLGASADTVIAGIAIASEFEPLDLDAQGTIGHQKNLFQTRIQVWRSLGGEIAADGEDYQTIDYETGVQIPDNDYPLLDGFYEIFHESSHRKQKYFRIQHSDPYPFTLQAVMQKFRPDFTPKR